MRAANATVEPLRVEEIPWQMLQDLAQTQLAVFQSTNGAVTLNNLRDGLESYQAAAHATDLAMQQAEEHGDVATMQAIATREQASRGAFFADSGLLENSYYHTIDRVYTSFPEIVFAGGNQQTITTATDRMARAIASATSALH